METTTITAVAVQPTTREYNGIVNLSMTFLLLAMCMITAIKGAASSPFKTAAQNSAPQNAADAAAVRTEMRNVMYHFTDSIVVHVRSFQGAVIPVGKNPFPIFDDKNSFDMKIDSAEIAMSASSLASA